jgi:hypothetical protein
MSAPLELCGVAKKKGNTASSRTQPKPPEIHIGALLREFIKAQGLNQAEIARRSFMTPQTLSGVFKRSSVQVDTLVRIGWATGHDFLADVSERTMGAIHRRPSVANDPQVNYTPRSGRAPIRFVIEADPDDSRTLKQVTELLRDLKSS